MARFTLGTMQTSLELERLLVSDLHRKNEGIHMDMLTAAVIGSKNISLMSGHHSMVAKSARSRLIRALEMLYN